MRNGLLLGLAGGLLFTAADAAAIELARYSFDGNSASAVTSGTVTSSDIAFGPFSNGAQSATIDSGSVFVGADDTRDNAAVGFDLLSDALTAGDYISFTIDDVAALSISSISYDYAVASNSGFSLSTHLLADVDGNGFAAADLLQTTTFTSNGSTNVSVDLSGNAGLQGRVDPLEVRVYFSDSTFAAGPNHRVDNIVVEGVPEPTSLALLGMAGAFVLFHRRRV